MTLENLSEKQKAVLKWAHIDSQRKSYNAIICDGAVRSGKTVVMTVGFIHWAMRYFESASFAICGRSIGSVERNIIAPLFDNADITGYYSVDYNSTKRLLTIKNGRRKNLFYIFGGKDETSYMSVQGITLCGVLFDEVVLMPRSFVEQCIARTLSVPQAKLWFNCNPAGPNHWFYKEWILDAAGENKKKIYYLHFTMDDNPTLSEAQKQKARAFYSGVFAKRYIDGEWAVAEGLVYPMFDEKNQYDGDIESGKYYISIDYGTRNPCSMGLWNISDGKAYRVNEMYYDSRQNGVQLTDEEYYERLKALAGNLPIRSVIVDPSAASFITLIRRHGRFNVIKAKNDVTDGIRYAGSMLQSGRILINRRCKDIIREFSLYCWDDNSPFDTVLKANDHAMDDMRYFCSTILRRKDAFSDSGAVSANYAEYIFDIDC